MEDTRQLIIILILVSLGSLGFSALLLSRLRELRRLVDEMAGRVAQVFSAQQDVRALARKSFEKPRKRYIIFKLITENPMGHSQVEKLLRHAVKSLYGEAGLSESRLYLAMYDPETRAGVIRVNALWKDRVIVATSLTREWEGNRVLIIPLRTTGSIKRAREIMRRMA